jgi:hypothetical protein
MTNHLLPAVTLTQLVTEKERSWSVGRKESHSATKGQNPFSGLTLNEIEPYTRVGWKNFPLVLGTAQQC